MPNHSTPETRGGTTRNVCNCGKLPAHYVIGVPVPPDPYGHWQPITNYPGQGKDGSFVTDEAVFLYDIRNTLIDIRNLLIDILKK